MTVYVAAEKVLDYFRKNKSRLKLEQILIAENSDTDYQVYLDIDETLDRPVIRVFYGDRFECESSMLESSVVPSVNDIYQRYLVPIEETPSTDDESDAFLSDEEEQAIDDLIYEREDALSLAASELLDVFLEDAMGDDLEDGSTASGKKKEQIVSDIVDSVAEILMSHDISIFRPTWIDMEDGSSEAVDYPYST